MPNLIEDNLYLGDLNDAANLKSSRNELKIKFVFSIGIFPTLGKSSNVTYRSIEVADVSSEDLLSHFDAAYEFILASQAEAPTLVHCFHGVSRSATIVIAFLMKRYGLDVCQAVERVKAAREVIAPNDGFMAQLELYSRMRMTLTLNFPAYKVYRLKKLAQIVREVRLVPSSYGELIKTDPGLTSTRPNPNVYKCRKCRRVLFNMSNVFEHRRGETFTWKTAETGSNSENEQTPQPCSEKIFIEPLVWMKDVRVQTSGKLNCPRCNAKLGSYSWIDYCVCSCRSKIFPFFYITPSKIDYDNVVKNVQVTI